MSISAKAVRFDDSSMSLDLSGGRVISVPLAWFPRLMNATHEQRAQVEISAKGLHWDALNEDIAVDGLLAGFGDQTRDRRTAA